MDWVSLAVAKYDLNLTLLFLAAGGQSSQSERTGKRAWAMEPDVGIGGATGYNSNPPRTPMSQST